MRESNCTQTASGAPPYSELVQQVTKLCNDLDQLVTMHHFFYQACEHYFEDDQLSFKRGLSMIPAWLREQDLSVLEQLHLIQQQLRAPLHKEEKP